MMPTYNREEAIDACTRELAAMGPRGIDYAIAAMQDVWESWMDDEIWEE